VNAHSMIIGQIIGPYLFLHSWCTFFLSHQNCPDDLLEHYRSPTTRANSGQTQ